MCIYENTKNCTDSYLCDNLSAYSDKTNIKLIFMADKTGAF